MTARTKGIIGLIDSMNLTSEELWEIRIHTGNKSVEKHEQEKQDTKADFMDEQRSDAFE